MHTRCYAAKIAVFNCIKPSFVGAGLLLQGITAVFVAWDAARVVDKMPWNQQARLGLPDAGRHSGGAHPAFNGGGGIGKSSERGLPSASAQGGGCSEEKAPSVLCTAPIRSRFSFYRSTSVPDTFAFIVFPSRPDMTGRPFLQRRARAVGRPGVAVALFRVEFRSAHQSRPILFLRAARARAVPLLLLFFFMHSIFFMYSVGRRAAW